MNQSVRHKQQGMTALGFIIIAAVCGVLVFAAMKLAPIYLENKRIGAVLQDIKAEMDGNGPTPTQIRLSLQRRLNIEMINLPREAYKISKSRNGYTVRVQYDNRTHYIGDLWLVVALDEQVEVVR